MIILGHDHFIRVRHNEEALAHRYRIGRPGCCLLVPANYALRGTESRRTTVDEDVHVFLCGDFNLDLFCIVLVKYRCVHRDLVIASIVLARQIAGTGLFIAHFVGCDVHLLDSGLEAHVRTDRGGTLDAAVLVVDGRAEGEHLVVPPIR